MKKDKIIEKYRKLIKGKVWTKQEINSFKKLLCSFHYIKDEQRKEAIKELHSLFSVETGKRHYNITKDHTAQGLSYLKSRVLLKRGGVSKSSGFEDYAEGIIKNFKKFEFIGLHEHYNSCWGSDFPSDFSPIFRIISKNDHNYDYSPIHWGACVVGHCLNYT